MSAPDRDRDRQLRQTDELQALRAIYAEDWHDIPPKKTAWGTANAAEEGWWEVRVRGEDERVQVGLKGRMTKMYPNQPPLLQLNEPHSLSPAHVQALYALLVAEAKRRVGQEMIYDLVELAREYMGTHHLPLPKPGEVQPTLMEQRLQREEAQRAAEAAQSLLEEEERRKAEQDRARELSARIQQDGEKKAERAERAEKEEEGRRRMESLQGLRDGELDTRLLRLESAIRVDGFEGRWTDWLLFGGKREQLWTVYSAEPASTSTSAIASSPTTSVRTTNGSDEYVKTSLPQVNVQVIDFSKPFYSEAMGKKKVEALVHEIARLKEVHSPHVRRIYAVKRTVSPKGWERIMIVVEKCGAGAMREWLPPAGFGEDKAKDYFVQVLRGLSEVCRVGATQRQLDLDSLLLCPAEQAGGDQLVKLCSTSYARKIIDLHRSNPFLGSYDDPIPESWLASDEIESPYSYNPKRDMYHAGLLFLQLIFGSNVLHRYPGSRILLQQEDHLSATTAALLSNLLNHNPKKRPSAEEALNELLTERKRLQISGLPSPSVSGSHSRNLALRSPLEVVGTSPVKDWYFSPLPLASHQSRYRQDFEEVEFLGKGGFGEVVKARNKLDGKFYAIKKIKLRPQDNEKKVLREVQTLSKVNHQFIVRYQHCWLEDATPPSIPSPPHDRETPNVKTSNGSSEPEDIFAVNFDDFSTGSARFDSSRSASFPRIRFANSDEDSSDEENSSAEEDDTEAESSSGETADPSQPVRSMFQTPALPVPARPSTTTGTHTTTEEGAVQKILYISMEFVEKQSLREAITQGLSNEEAWRLFGQILQALAYMASLGIVHRDLKPSNILLDSLGNVKIADFGLSTTEITADPHHHHHLPIGHSADGNDERTSNIGTSLYIAPEVAMTRSYNEKADMYSLGIIFFEMCFRFSTAMERVHILTALRRAAIEFPPAWPVGLVNQREIVNYLLQHDPTKRPSATTLLTSPLLPSPERQQEYYDSAIRELTSTRSAQYPNLLKALFKPRRDQPWTDDRTDDYLYDNLHLSSRSSAVIASYEIWESVVVSRLAQLFERHGAVETQLPLLLPETTLLEAFPDVHPVRLLDGGGKIVQLPYNGLLGLARTAARRGVERNKRYLVGRKYREHRAGGQPEAGGQLCFDIISPLKSHAADAEVLEVADQVFGELSGGKASNNDWEIHVNHEGILGIVLNAVPERQRQQVLRIFQSGQVDTGRTPFGSISGLSRSLLDDLEALIVPAETNIHRARLETAFPAQKRKIVAAMDELDSVIAFARTLGVARRILLRPTLAKHAEYFRSAFFFEAVSVRRGKARDTIAYGGRYDSLLAHFQEPGLQGRQVFGAGISLDIDTLVRTLQRSASSAAEKLMKKENEEERSFGFWMPTRCDVYVASVAQVDLQARLSIMGELWRGGIRADLQYDDDRTVDVVAEECVEQNILFLLLPRANRQMTKIRSILRRTEEEVPFASMVAYLRQAIADQRRIDASYAAVEPSLPSTANAASGAGDKSELDIKLILPPEPQTAKGTKGRPVRKHRHGTKAVYYEKAEDFAASTQSRLPIYGVDLPLTLLSEMTRDAAWVGSDEAWRAVMAKEALSTGDKKYAEQVREAVKEGAKRDGWCWLFGVREGRGFLLQLGTK